MFAPYLEFRTLRNVCHDTHCILQGPILNSGAIFNLLLRLQRLIRCLLFPLLIQTAMTGPLDDGGAITRGHAEYINAFATMHGHQR